MIWKTKYTGEAYKQLRKMDKTAARRVESYVNELSSLNDPRQRGKALTGVFGGLWRYQVGDYRVICKIIDGELTVIVIRIAHRSRAYRE
ncbi:type II toxin-antitoxin system RelE/ParE family toxin [Mobiluncus mulieris]|uniref:Type II toxin-antitoxin system RelE/ParE family toxin n=2 Tax=Mobiluncus mulieris TaxID=2052 RepID=A0A7Y0U7M5_9ACTO|nr:type II toxin-antitoxin system RelE/ParE family toxin [Mobiluncus mulieris]MCU9974400.1 type II toxin-antitoxin system RelE/ParE family toxin [Mobiluncus mulieris]NMW66175.1 type II toxin-antitoxin system RelE/ParE family toxin [Mobiluncus mulieris]NMW76137.1 type II toxin-antitoxin system RelE/ParE family toxin [Mobiluncus mulieris]NMX12640.1 type II toxin-antitoxin system RelE/ParE family toxin [Mobiluncus mulieris]